MFLKLAKMKALPKRKKNYKCVILLISLVAIIPFVSVNFMMKPACGKLYQNELQQKAFLHSEIQKLEAKRQQLLREIEEYSRNTSPIRRKASIPVDDSSQREQEFKDHDVITVVNKPKDLSELSHRQKRKNCKLSSCFEFKKCPYDREFTVHIYKPYNFGRSVGGNSVTEVYNILKSMPYVKEVNEPIACVFVVIIDPSSLQNSSKLLENVLHNLTFWQGDGHNHIIINFGKGNLLKNVDTGRALVVQTTFGSQAPYRPEFDIVIPPLLSLTKSGVVWENSATQLPAKRKYLLSFAGNYHDNSDKVSNAESFTSVGDLKQLSLQAEDIYIQVSCQAEKNFANYSDWQLCWSRSVRAKILKESTFSLIIQLGDDQTMTLVRLMEALQYGAIPVLISDNVTLPFNDVIDWYRAAIILHEAQFSQMNLILRAILVNDLLSIRRQGRFLWEAYLSTTKSVLESTMAAIQTRLFLPGIPLQGTYFHSVFSEENEPKFYRSNTDVVTRTQSPISYHNLPTNTVHARQRWNAYPGALFSPPVSPFMPALPSSPPVFESSENMQPIRTAVDAGAEFQKALGGNYPVEQFTIVVLTYKREKILKKALGRLKHMPYLNKVIVIWNTPGDPYSNLTWPNISVPVKVSQYLITDALFETVESQVHYLKLQPARLKSQRELRFESAVPVAIFTLTDTLPVTAKHLYPSPVN